MLAVILLLIISIPLYVLYMGDECIRYHVQHEYMTDIKGTVCIPMLAAAVLAIAIHTHQYGALVCAMLLYVLVPYAGYLMSAPYYTYNSQGHIVRRVRTVERHVYALVFTIIFTVLAYAYTAAILSVV